MTRRSPAAPSFVAFCERGLSLPLTPAQRALAAVSFDGAPVPADFDDMFGTAATPPADARRTIVWLCGRNSGKSRQLAAYVLYRCLFAKVPKLAKGELAFGLLVAPTLDLAGQSLRFARGMLNGTPFEQLVTADATDHFDMQRPDGKLARVQIVAADRGGASVRGKTIVAAALDETAFFRDARSGVVNDRDLYNAITPRVVAGGAVVLASTPWTQSGLFYDLWNAEYGKPATAIVAVAKTERMRPDDPELHARIAQARIREPENAAREYDCEWLPAGAGSLFDNGSLVRAVVDAEPLPATAFDAIYIGGDLGLVTDPSAFVAVRVKADDQIEVVDALEIRPSKGKALSLTAVLRELEAFCEKNHMRRVVVDRHVLEAARDTVIRENIHVSLEACSESAQDREQRYRRLADRFAAGKVTVPRRFAKLTEQLSRITATPRSGGGYTFAVARRGGDHADLAMALILASDQHVTFKIGDFGEALGMVLNFGSMRAGFQPGYEGFGEMLHTDPLKFR